jgi:hypothetical protein
MRLFSLDRWNLWPRLTLYRQWRGPQDARLDGTNNATERSIGWRVKERYRTMRGYKRKTSVLNVSRLITGAGNLLDAGGADLAAVIAQATSGGERGRRAAPQSRQRSLPSCEQSHKCGECCIIMHTEIPMRLCPTTAPVQRVGSPHPVQKHSPSGYRLAPAACELMLAAQLQRAF